MIIVFICSVFKKSLYLCEIKSVLDRWENNETRLSMLQSLKLGIDYAIPLLLYICLIVFSIKRKEGLQTSG